MQEEVEQKTMALSVRTARLTAELLQKAFRLFFEAQKNKPQEFKQGKQTLKELMKQNTNISSIEITHDNIKDFEGTARKYGIDFALKKDISENPPRYQDAVDNRAEKIESLKADLESGNVEGLTNYLKEIIEEGEYMVPEATALLGRIEAIVPQKEEVKESKISFYAAEDMEFHHGRFRENLTVEQAIEAYRQIEHPRGIKGIGVQSEDFEWGLVGGKILNLEDLQYVPQVAANLQVQEAIKIIYQNMPELTVVGKEEYLKNAEVQLEDDYGMIDGIINNGPKEEKQTEKPSIIAEIKAAQKEAAEKKREPKEKHHNKSHGHEL